jgi:hypothetical protein
MKTTKRGTKWKKLRAKLPGMYKPKYAVHRIYRGLLPSCWASLFYIGFFTMQTWSSVEMLITLGILGHMHFSTSRISHLSNGEGEEIKIVD